MGRLSAALRTMFRRPDVDEPDYARARGAAPDREGHMAEVAYNPSEQYGRGGPMPSPPQPDDETRVVHTAPYAEDHEPGQVHSFDVEAATAAVGPTAPPDETAPAGSAAPGGEAADAAASASQAAPPGSSWPSGRVAAQVVDRLRNNAERGTTTVPTEVIEKVAVMAIREVPGVYQFDPVGGDGERPISIQLDGRSAVVSLSLVIEYGFAVYAVTDKVRTKVISALENLFGLDVTAVDIVVTDVHLEEPDAKTEE